jgi:molybdopterin converting factor small subunit
MVRVNIFYPGLKQATKEQEPLIVKGSTIGRCLKDLIQQFPAAGRLLFDEQGQLLKQVFVYLNKESISQPALDTAVKDSDVLIIAFLITGG